MYLAIIVWYGMGSSIAKKLFRSPGYCSSPRVTATGSPKLPHCKLNAAAAWFSRKCQEVLHEGGAAFSFLLIEYPSSLRLEFGKGRRRGMQHFANLQPWQQLLGI
jgi:hypothetical protein